MNKIFAAIARGCHRSVMMLILTLCTVSTLLAQAPVRITRFYPDKVEDTQELRNTTTIFIFLQNLTGKDITATGLDMRLIQNGEVIGDGSLVSDRLGDMVPNGTCGLGFPVSKYPQVFGKMGVGLVTLEVYGVTYTDSDGNVIHWSDPENILDDVTYRILSNAFVESSEGFEDGIFRSYYPEDSDEGVLKIHISVPIRKEGIRAFLEYGTSNASSTTDVETQLSADRKTVIIDFRGVARPASVLAQGKTFTDDDGNVYVPTTVTLNVNGMYADDGAVVESFFTNPVTGYKVSISGAFFSFDYVDESFPNPVLRQAKFFDSANPDVTYNNILPNTDKMVVAVDHSEFITNADMVITCGTVAQTVAYDQIEKGNGKYIVTLSDEIRAAGSANMVISLANVEFTYFDGVEHVVEPLDLAGAVIEVFSLAEAKTLPIGEEFILNSQDLIVTFANGGYVFMEDDSAGVRVIGDGAAALEVGLRLFGKFSGANQGGNTITFNPQKSTLTTGSSTMVTGLVITDEEELTNEANQCLYVTAVATDELPIVAQDGMLILGNSVVGVLDLYEFEVPEKTYSVTGVLYEMAGTKLIIVCDFNIIQPEQPEMPQFTSFADMIAAAPEGEILLDLNNAVVTFASEYGDFFIEDETAAIRMAENSGVQPKMGTSYLGQVKGTFMADALTFVFDQEDLVAVPSMVDVSEGQRVKVNDILSGEFDYRLVTVYFEDEPIIRDFENFGALIGTKKQVYVVEFFNTIPDLSWEFPVGAEKVTGIVYPLELQPMGLLAAEVSESYLLAIRGVDDIVSLPAYDSIADVLEQTEYNDTFILKLNDAKVTYSFDNIASFVIEDATAATGMYYFEAQDVIREGQMINGEMVCLNLEMADGVIAYPSWGSFETTDADISTGLNLTYEEMLDEKNLMRLVTLTSEEHTFELIDEDSYLVDNLFEATWMRPFDLHANPLPKDVKQITGLLMKPTLQLDEEGPAFVLNFRYEEDVVEDTSAAAIETVTPDMVSGAVYNLQGIQVRSNSDDLQGLKGVYILNGRKVILN